MNRNEAVEDIIDFLTGLDGDYADDIGAAIALGKDSQKSNTMVVEVYYEDYTVEAEINIQVQNIRRVDNGPLR